MAKQAGRLTGPPGRSDSSDLAMVGYGLLLAAVFLAGAPALIAVVIAYSQRGHAPEWLRRHYDLQLRIFWIAFALALAAGACGLAGVTGAMGEMLGQATVVDSGPAMGLSVDLGRVVLDHRVLALLAAAVGLALLCGLWLLIASVYGFIRLASQQGMVHSAAR